MAKMGKIIFVHFFICTLLNMLVTLFLQNFQKTKFSKDIFLKVVIFKIAKKGLKLSISQKIFLRSKLQYYVKRAHACVVRLIIYIIKAVYQKIVDNRLIKTKKGRG